MIKLVFFVFFNKKDSSCLRGKEEKRPTLSQWRGHTEGPASRFLHWISTFHHIFFSRMEQALGCTIY